MENVVPIRIQIISIVVSISFLLYIGYLVVKGKLREEYAIFWVISTLILILFSFWREGLEIISKMLGVYSAPNLIFTGAIFGVFIYLIHLSVVVSKLHEKNKKLSQELALMKNKKEKEKSE
jgi:hypothetical protein